MCNTYIHTLSRRTYVAILLIGYMHAYILQSKDPGPSIVELVFIAT